MELKDLYDLCYSKSHLPFERFRTAMLLLEKYLSVPKELVRPTDRLRVELVPPEFGSNLDNDLDDLLEFLGSEFMKVPDSERVLASLVTVGDYIKAYSLLEDERQTK
jgi:hypothetical protein